MKHRTPAVLLAAAALAAALATALPAAASTQAAHRIGAVKLCLANDGSECAKSQGSSPMQTYMNGYSTWTPNFVSNYVVFVNGSGNCAHGTDNNFVTVSSACGSGNTASQWFEEEIGGHLGYKNSAYGGIMYANCDGNGCTVVLAPQGTPGDWLVNAPFTS